MTDTPESTPPATGFDFNRPTIVALLYISSFVLGVTALVGVILAYVWRGEPQDGWEASHYTYLIRTFWIGLIGGLASVALMVVLIGFLTAVAVMVLVVVRTVLSIVAAQRRQPMPDPATWWV